MTTLLVMVGVFSASTQFGLGAGPAFASGGVRAANLVLVGGDDFTGPANTLPNPDFWRFDTGGGGWGNNEKQVYTNSTDNVRQDGFGRLVVEARRSGDGYTSARVVTRGKFEFTHGRVEARVKLPGGNGIHPAFWTLGSNIGTVGWPRCGEIDVIELVGSGDDYFNALHGPKYSLWGGLSGRWTRDSAGSTLGTDLTQDFHTYTLERSLGRIQIFIDGVRVGDYSASGMVGGERWVFDAPAYLLFNVAVGGNWPGPTDSTTPFPATMLVDWVRYWELR